MAALRSSLAAVLPGRTRASFYAWAAVVTQILLRFERVGGWCLPGSYPAHVSAPHRPGARGLRAPVFGGSPPAGRRAARAARVVRAHGRQARSDTLLRPAGLRPAADRSDRDDRRQQLVLVEISPHRDMDSHPTRRSQTTPFDVHFEGLLPGVAGQRFYSQMIDGWVWSIWRGQVVGDGTFRGPTDRARLAEAFVEEMRRWGVRHFFVWTDATRNYLVREPCVRRSGGGTDRWSHFEQPDADERAVIAADRQRASATCRLARCGRRSRRA